MTDELDPVYGRYWEGKRLRTEHSPVFPVKRWWDDADLCEIERLYFDAVKEAPSLLDVGAGDLRVRNKFVKAGFTGEYHTQDVGTEYPHDYRDLADVHRTYQAILCLDVIEHLPLREGLTMVLKMVDLLGPGGVLVLQTPNSRCVVNPLSWDMTHLHCYNLPDLWSYLAAHGLDTQGFRVTFERPDLSLLGKLRSLSGRINAVKVVGMDYAANIALIARKPTSQGDGDARN